MSIIERVYQFIDYKAITINEFSNKVGVSNGYFAKQRANSANIGSHIIEKIVRTYPELNLKWLFLNEGEMIEDFESKSPQSTTIYSSDPRDAEIIGLQRSKIELLEEKIDELKKELTELRSVVQTDTSYSDVATSSAVFRAHKQHD